MVGASVVAGTLTLVDDASGIVVVVSGMLVLVSGTVTVLATCAADSAAC